MSPIIYALDEATLAGLERMGEKSARKLVAAIARSKPHDPRPLSLRARHA
jgi:NAD-dependent DNA ligase